MTTELPQTSPWIALARPMCQTCDGTGLRGADHCACVLRRVTRAVLAHVRSLQARIGSIHPLALDSASAPQGKKRNGILSIEYVSDVYNTARRVLLDPVDWDLWCYHCLGGHPWYACCPHLGLNRGNFYHRLYEIEARMGRTFLELAPYSLFPIHCYTDTKLERVRPCPAIEETRPGNRALRPPLAKPARQAPIVLVPAPQNAAPVRAPAPLAIASANALAGHIRKAFGSGRTLRAIANELGRLNVPAPQGKAVWTGSDVRTVLLNAPCQRARGPRLRKAA